MSVNLFLALLIILAVAVSLITEAVKTFLGKKKYSANVIVLVVSIVVGAGGTIITYLFYGIPFTAVNVVCIPLMAVAVWVGAMVGYDKVLQMISQIKELPQK